MAGGSSASITHIRSGRGRPDNFKSPEILLEDYFREVERVLRELSVDATPVNLRKRR
jgi:hypothetical protein